MKMIGSLDFSKPQRESEQYDFHTDTTTYFK